MRLDQQYLQFAREFREIITSPGTVMTDAQFALFKKPGNTGTSPARALNSSEKAFVRATSFLLNFYEVVAVATFRHDLDRDLLKRTSRGNIVRLVITCSPLILEMRSREPDAKTWEHLVWYYQTFARNDDLPPALLAELGSAAVLPLGPKPSL